MRAYHNVADGCVRCSLHHRERTAILVRYAPTYFTVTHIAKQRPELEDILHIPDRLTLDRLDATLRRFVSFCAAYHGEKRRILSCATAPINLPAEQYLQSPLQMEHAYDLLLASELLAFHSERMSDILLDDARNVCSFFQADLIPHSRLRPVVLQATDPHLQLILYSVLLVYGRQNMSFLRSQKRWQPLLPLLMDNVVLDVDPGVEDTYSGLVTGSSSGGQAATAVPIEAKLRSLSVRLLYEVCRVQKLSLPELGRLPRTKARRVLLIYPAIEIFSDTFIDYLFELVEQTRHMQDETFNYSVIKLIVRSHLPYREQLLTEPGGSERAIHGRFPTITSATRAWETCVRTQEVREGGW